MIKNALKQVIGSNSLFRLIFAQFQNSRRKYTDLRAKKLSRISREQDHKKVFDFIYQEKFWNTEESVSGGGSTLEMTKKLRPLLETMLAEMKVKKFLDVPCGDFNWMKEVQFGDIEYIGGDIVKELIDELNAKYAGPKRKFIQLDLVSDPLPEVDMIFVRDCFIHLSNDLVLKALENIRKSNIKYLVTTHFPNMIFNVDIETGQFRAINLTKAPFNLPAATKVINEGFDDPLLSDNSLGIWKISDLRSVK